MPNGASMSDWLSTTEIQASSAAHCVREVTVGQSGHNRLLQARAHLAGALEDLDTILAAIKTEGEKESV